MVYISKISNKKARKINLDNERIKDDSIKYTKINESKIKIKKDEGYQNDGKNKRKERQLFFQKEELFNNFHLCKNNLFKVKNISNKAYLINEFNKK